MAQKTVVELIDDLDGETGEGIATVEFSYRGIDYEIDLNDHNRQVLDETMADYVSAGRRVGGRKKSPKTSTGGGSGPARRDKAQTQAIREWARAQGYEVSERGRIPQGIEEAYNASGGANLRSVEQDHDEQVA